jgi:hypothetical protein
MMPSVVSGLAEFERDLNRRAEGAPLAELARSCHVRQEHDFAAGSRVIARMAAPAVGFAYRPLQGLSWLIRMLRRLSVSSNSARNSISINS